MRNGTFPADHPLAGADIASVRTIEAARAKLATDPKHRPTLRILSAALRKAGEHAAAEQTEIAAIQSSLEEPAIREASAALSANRPGMAERLLRPYLAQDPNDAAAMRLLADVASRAGKFGDAETLLGRALALAPAFDLARRELAILLHKTHRLDEAIAVVDERLAAAPGAGDLLYLKAVLLSRSGRTNEAVAASAHALSAQRDSPVLWLNHGRLLASLGRREEAVAAIRSAVRLNPRFGEAWWSLADLDPRSLTEADIDEMGAQAESDAIRDREQIPIRFALARANEERGRAESAFRHLQTAHALRRQGAPYQADDLTRYVAEGVRALGPDQRDADQVDHRRAPGGPIFVLGMHRAGSTLVEQILSSHPEVEGLAELPHLAELAASLGPLHGPGGGSPFLGSLAALSKEQAATLGQTYLQRVAPRRLTNRAFFTDKMPGNWRFVPLIATILPEARIIDVRRDPLDCCVSNYCRYYAHGQNHADDLGDLGRFYRDYAAFMQHMDAILPGRVLRVKFERLVEDTEREIRRLLDHCGLPFDAACLRFFETERPVRTPSAQQVRQPINRRGIGRYRLFEPWLDPLKEALGPELAGA